MQTDKLLTEMRSCPTKTIMGETFTLISEDLRSALTDLLTQQVAGDDWISVESGVLPDIPEGKEYVEVETCSSKAVIRITSFWSKIGFNNIPITIGSLYLNHLKQNKYELRNN